MLFRTQPTGSLAISQLTHAWISGQILRTWASPLSEPLLLAAEQHDIGWLDWEVAPSFNPETGLPHLFRDVGASIHAPMWQKGVDRALGAWGSHVALLISRHGGVIYRRFTDRHQLAEADAIAARHYLSAQAQIEADWASSLGFDASMLKTQSTLVALVDTLSLALCGELKAPLDIEAPMANGEIGTVRLTERPGHPFEFILSPWPFVTDVIDIEGPARPLPAEGRFADETAMRLWLTSSERSVFTARLRSPTSI